MSELIPRADCPTRILEALWRMPVERLQKLMARAGLASRRAAERMIAAGRVHVNGTVARLGRTADPEVDRIDVDGLPLTESEPKAYLALHKPKGVVSTAKDPQGRTTVLDLVRHSDPETPRLYPVGRLDMDSTGLIILTNDGELAHALTHPRFHVPKTYRVEVAGHPSKERLSQLRRGIELDDGRTAPTRVRILQSHRHGTTLSFVLYEGRKRQIRRMCGAVGSPVLHLERRAIGPIRLGRLAPGACRKLTAAESARLREAAHPQGGGG